MIEDHPLSPGRPHHAPRHHLPEDVLLEYALGTAEEGVALMAATHVSLCPRCLHEVSLVEAGAGSLLPSANAVDEGDAWLTDTLAKLDAAPASDPGIGQPRVQGGSTPAWLPAVVADYVQRAGGLRWRFVTPGIQRVRVYGKGDGVTATLLRLQPGSTIPHHDHAGDEYAQVFTGGFRAGDRHYVSGDLLFAPTGHQHNLLVDPHEVCFSLIVAEAPTIPLTAGSRLWRFLGLG